MIKPIPRYVDHLWYPILVPVIGSGSCRIVEMQGKKVNEWNDYVRRQDAVVRRIEKFWGISS